MANRERLIRTLMDLIRIDSPTGEEDAMDREVTARLQALGFIVHHDSFGNVIARLDGVGEPVLLSAHLDTVEPGRGIKPVLHGDTLRSDGSTILGGDCKAGVSIILEGVASLLESGAQHLPVEVAFSRAEEGGLVGVHHMDFSRLSARRGVVFDAEGGVNRITVAAPAQNVVKAHIQGRAAHAGLEPENGISAVLIAAQILTQLPLGRIDAETTSNIGRVEGGLKRNIIPEAAEMDGEIRSRDPAKLDRYTRRFREVFDGVAARYPEARVSLEIEHTYSSFSVDAAHPTVVMISRALADAGLEPQLEGSGGGSDANVFFERGIAALPVGIGVRGFHTREESVIIPEVVQGADVCQRILQGGPADSSGTVGNNP